MRRKRWMTSGAVLLVTALAPVAAAWADFEVTGPDGRKILLKDDNTWRYVEASAEPEKPAPVVIGEGVLTLERMVELGSNCQIGFRLQNDTNYEIRNIVPQFIVYRTSGIAYEGRTLAFYSIFPGNSSYRETLFRGIACKDIGRVQVAGGDRCTMGDLDKFSYTGGACLDRVRVVPSDLVRFDK
jgi:hypothetical protein